MDDAKVAWEMQTKAFLKHLEKYQDYNASPAAENLERAISRMQDKYTYYYLIQSAENTVGVVRVVDKKDGIAPKRL